MSQVILNKWHRLWVIPTVLVLIFTFFSTHIDLEVSRFFYKLYPQFQPSKIWKFVYHWGVWPALISGGFGIWLLLMQISPKWQKYRSGALMALLTLIIGPGLLINNILKPTVPRPRPVQIKQFEGKADYKPVQDLRFHYPNEHHKSFPSGHIAMGFYFLCLFRIAVRERKMFWAGVTLAFCFFMTFLLTWTRLAQGGHFFSDAIFSGYFVWMVTLALEYYCYGKPYSKDRI